MPRLFRTTAGSTWVISIALLVLTIAGCTGDPVMPEPPTEPPYYIGFTPFPYDVTTAAVEWVYQQILADGNIVAHHFDNGIPWPEALAGDDFHPNLTADWEYRKTNTPASHKIYLAITPIHLMRDTLAPYRGESEDMPLPPPWNTYTFNHDSIKAAYYNYCVRTIDFFDPDFVCIGIEVNLLMANAPDKWDAYTELHQYVYPLLTARYPELPIMVSFTGMELINGYTDADHVQQMQALADMMPYTDYFGLSMHVFISALQADSIPNAVLDQIYALRQGKTVAICECSYPADTFSVSGIDFYGTPAKQVDYFTKILARADTIPTAFVIDFLIRDYEALWEAMGSPDDFTKLWKETGLYDEGGAIRPALTEWRGRLR